MQRAGACRVSCARVAVGQHSDDVIDLIKIVAIDSPTKPSGAYRVSCSPVRDNMEK